MNSLFKPDEKDAKNSTQFNQSHMISTDNKEF